MFDEESGRINLKLMSEHNMAYGLPQIIKPKEVCTGCLLAKQTRKAFPCQVGYRAKHVLELVYGDLCGPLSPATPGGNRYFLLLVDDYSRFMWIYMLNRKDEAL